MSRSALRRTLARCRAAGRLGPRLGLLVGVLAVGIGLLVSCDSSVSTHRPLSETAASADSTTVKHTPMPTGTSLPEPGSGPRGTLRAYRAAGDRKSKSGAAESPYGCYLASRPYSEEVRFRSVYLYFPDEIIEAAGGETEQIVLRLWGRRRGEVGRTDVRLAHCVVPEAERAGTSTLRQVARVGEAEAVAAAVRADSTTAPKTQVARNEDCELEVIGTICMGSYCWEEKEEACDTDPFGGREDDGDHDPDPYWEGGSGGDDDEGGGGGADCRQSLPEPGSECEPVEPEPVNEQKLCPSDPLKDMDIRATGCGENASIEGGRYGDTRGPNNNQFHAGIDLLNDVGDPVYAAEGGTIWGSGKATNGYGYYVIVKTGKEEFQYYTHLKKGSQISEHPPGEDSGIRSIDQETVVGKTGTTGNADTDCSGGPPHVHFEVRTGATTWGEASPVNPEKHLGTKFDDGGQPVSDSC